jgi:hypothetical protein
MSIGPIRPVLQCRTQQPARVRGAALSDHPVPLPERPEYVGHPIVIWRQGGVALRGDVLEAQLLQMVETRACTNPIMAHLRG